MYKAIKEKFEIINQAMLSKKVGITPEAMCRIINGKQNTSKTTAYCIVKSIHNEAEIEDYFIKEK